MLWYCLCNVYFRNKTYSRFKKNGTLTPSKFQMSLQYLPLHLPAGPFKVNQTWQALTKKSRLVPQFPSVFLVLCCYVIWHLELDSKSVCSQTVVHAQGALQLLDNTLVKSYLLLEVGLHHVFEVHLSPLMEVAHLCLEGKSNCPAAFPNAVGLVLVHPAFVTHPLALLHLGKGTWVEIKWNNHDYSLSTQSTRIIFFVTQS